MSHSIPSGLPTPGAAAFVNLEGIYGPFLIGIIISTALWGVTCVQSYDYFSTPNDDRLWQRLTVALLCILDTFDTAINTHTLYHYLIRNFLNPYALVAGVWSVSCRPLFNGLASFIVRAVFARRVYLVSKKNKILTLWIMATSSAQLVVEILLMAKAIIGVNSETLPSVTHLIYVSFSFGTASDASTTLALYWLLHSAKTGIRRTDSLVKVLLLYIVTTCLLVVINSVLGLIFFSAMPGYMVYFGFYILTGKLYTNAFLASLNIRENLRKDQTDVVLTLSQMHGSAGQNRQSLLTTDNGDKQTFHRSDNGMGIALQTSMERRAYIRESKSLSSADVA